MLAMVLSWPTGSRLCGQIQMLVFPWSSFPGKSVETLHYNVGSLQLFATASCWHPVLNEQMSAADCLPCHPPGSSDQTPAGFCEQHCWVLHLSPLLASTRCELASSQFQGADFASPPRALLCHTLWGNLVPTVASLHLRVRCQLSFLSLIFMCDSSHTFPPNTFIFACE